MTYRDVEDRFVARFHARNAKAGVFALVWIELEGQALAGIPSEPEQRVAVVWSLGPTSADVALAATREALESVVPDSADLEPTVFGTGRPVAFLFERSAPAVLEIRSLCPAANMAGAVSLALCWLW